MKVLGRWIAETRTGRTTFRFVTLGVIGLVVYLAIWEEVGRQTRDITRRISIVESADPCVALDHAAKHGAGPRKIRRLTPPCVAFLNELGPLISHKLACDIFDAGGRPCARTGPAAASEVPERGDASQPAPVAGQRPQPGRPGGGGGVERPDRGSDERPAPRSPDSAAPAAPPSPAPPAVPAPSLLSPQSNGKGTPEPPPQAKGPIGSTVDAVTDAGCSVTNPVLGICLR